MSNETYTRLLNQTTELVSETVQVDCLLQNEIVVDRVQVRKTCIELYYRYISAANRLNQCYDQMVQPQKRRLVRKLLDNCLGRVLELRNDLMELDLTEYSWDDEVLLKLKMNPLEAELDIPEYFLRENEEELLSRRQFVDDTLTRLGYNYQEKEEVQLTEHQAVLIIQSHERARQGRLRGQFMKEIKLLKDRGKVEITDDQEQLRKAAVLIQKIWRGHQARRRAKKLKMAEMVLIGMVEQPPVEKIVLKKGEEIAAYRREVQKQREDEYQEALQEIEQRVRSDHTDRLTDEFCVELRHWLDNYFKINGKLPEIPSEDAGGSRNIFSRIGMDSEVSKSPGSSSKESSKKSKEKDKKSKSSDAKTREEQATTDMESQKNAPSNFLAEIISAQEEFEEVWKFKDETMNPYQKLYTDMIESEKLSAVEKEVRQIVDEMMRYELEQLQAAIDRDRAMRGKKPKKPQKKKVRRGGKKSKKKREKDLTPDRTTESLFEELVSNGIIKQYPKVRIKDFIGEKQFAATQHDDGIDFEPCLGDVRQLVKETCIIPLGSEYVHQTAPVHRGVLIAGPPGSGKKMLVHAICTEVGAVLFDLTPANIVGKYPGKTGLIMLLHLISKVTRLLQPAVVWIDHAERPFTKKVPKSDKSDPKRLKKDLFKLIKGVAAEEKVIFIGTSYCPWDADQKLLQQCYSKIIYIPRPDYGTMSLFWRVQIRAIGGVQPDFNVSTLSRICDGYTLGTILAALETILTTKRKLQLCVRGLSSLEIVSALSTLEVVYWEQDELAAAWVAKLPLARRRAARRRLEAEELEAAAAAAAK